jgi:catechol 2,3-dioxygenase-like lactoylglutathione lyase family enzyme
MLLNGFNHVAVLTKDTERFVTFYQEVFEAEVFGRQSMGPMGTLTLLRIGEEAEINLFEVVGNTEADPGSDLRTRQARSPGASGGVTGRF